MHLAADGPAGLPELAAVGWRARVGPAALRRRGRVWTLSTVAQSLPFGVAAVALAVALPVTLPIGLLLVLHGIAIPELYAARGAGVLRPRRRLGAGPERTALGLLGDLLDHRARDLHGQTGLVLEPGALGQWVLGEAGAVLVRPGGRRVFCFCVGVREADLPSADRIAHLLLALREDEVGLATVANTAFSGASGRLLRRLPGRMRPALRAAIRAASREAAAGLSPSPSLAHALRSVGG